MAERNRQFSECATRTDRSRPETAKTDKGLDGHFPEPCGRTAEVTDEPIFCPSCRSFVLVKDYDAHVKSDHQEYMINKETPNPAQATGRAKGMNGREQLAEVIKTYPQAAIILFIIGC